MAQFIRLRRPLAALLAVGLATSLLSILAQERDASGRKYALLIGVRQYPKGELTSLEYPERDVEELARVFLDSGYKKENVVLMTESAGARDADLLPTGAHIREQLQLLLQGRAEEDSVVVAFAGHGVQYKDSEDPYFCPADAHLAQPESLLSLKEVYRQLKDSKAGFKLLLADACRDKPLPRGSRAAGDLESVTRPQKVPPPGGVAALFSCSADQKAYEDDKFQQGVFFHFVIEGLKGKAAGGKGGAVSLSELADYVEQEVPDYVRVESRAGQVPELVGLHPPGRAAGG